MSHVIKYQTLGSPTFTTYLVRHNKMTRFYLDFMLYGYCYVNCCFTQQLVGKKNQVFSGVGHGDLFTVPTNTNVCKELSISIWGKSILYSLPRG